MIVTLHSLFNHRPKNDNYIFQYPLKWCLTSPHSECQNHKRWWCNFLHPPTMSGSLEWSVWNTYKINWVKHNPGGTRFYAVLDNHPGLYLPRRWLQNLKQSRPSIKGHSFFHTCNPVKKLTYFYSILNAMPSNKLENNFKLVANNSG